MDRYAGLPTWLQRSKKSLKQSQEWQTFMMKLYDLVHHQMQEMGVTSFNDLAPPERQLLLQRGFHALKTSETYYRLLEVASESLDQSVSTEADKLSSTKQQNKSKIEILQEECHNAVTSLLQKWPDSRTSLRHCLNADIPLELRYVMWKNFLKNPKARESYLMLVASDPKKLVSKLDFEISEKCQMLLDSDPTLKQIPNRKAVCSIMRHLLSHWHTTLGGRGALVETDFLLTVPLVICTLAAKQVFAHAGSEKQLTTESLATLVEEFHAFMRKRPAYMMSTQGASLEDLSIKTAAILRKEDKDLALAMENYKIGQKDSPNTKLEAVLPLLLHSIVRSLFVGYFPIETVMHAWDIIILGFDRPDYDAVPYLCTAILLLLRADLIKSRSEKEASTTIIQGCRSVHKSQLILALKEFTFEKQLKENLDISDEDHFPSFHPVVKSNLAPWKHWYSNKIVAQIDDDRNPRPKKVVITDPTTPGPSHLSNGYDAQVWELEHIKIGLEEESERLREERDALASDIENEKRLRVEIQQHADEEIDRLTKQLNAMKRTGGIPIPVPVEKPRTPTPPDPVTNETPTSKTPEKEPTPVPSPKPDSKPSTPKPETPVQRQPTPKVENSEERQKAKKVTDDFLGKMMNTFSLLAHGNAKDRKELERMTRKDEQKLANAVGKAQKIVYGKIMTDEQIKELPEAEREEKSAKMQEEAIKILFKKK